MNATTIETQYITLKGLLMLNDDALIEQQAQLGWELVGIEQDPNLDQAHYEFRRPPSVDLSRLSGFCVPIASGQVVRWGGGQT